MASTRYSSKHNHVRNTVLCVLVLAACVLGAAFLVVRYQQTKTTGKAPSLEAEQPSLGSVLSQEVRDELLRYERSSTSIYSECDVVDAAKELLYECEHTGEGQLVYAGYLDLEGNVWACMQRYDEHISIDLIRAENTGSVHNTICIDINEWKVRYEELGI